MSWRIDRWAVAVGLVLVFLCLGFARSASAEYRFSPELSLTGNCSVSTLDPVADPGCPDPPHPPSGRFDRPRSVAIDSFGNEYVAVFGSDGTKGRVDVFDDQGFFITELPDPYGPKSVAVDSKGNLYVFEQAPGANSEVALYEPTVYEPEAGEIEYSNPRVVIDIDVTTPLGGLAVDSSNDHLFATYGGTFIQEYSAAAEGSKLVGTITHENLHTSNWVAIDAERRRLYASSCQAGIKDCGVLVFDADSPSALLEEINGSGTPGGDFLSEKGWLSIAVDEKSGHFFVDDLERTKNVYEFDEDYQYVRTISSSGFEGGDALQIAVSNAPDAFNYRYLFVPVVSASGRVLAFEPPGVEAPEILGAAPISIGETEAELRATIDPVGGDTGYVMDYVSQAVFEKTGFAEASIGGEGVILSSSPLQKINIILSNLSPGVAYRFRIRATNSAGEADPAEGGFTTYSDAPVSGGCPNQGLRTGPSSALPDCRAYELVTPPDTNGRPPEGVGVVGDRFATVEVSPPGDAVSFVTEGGSLPGTEGSGGFNGDLYRASRTLSGWVTAGAGPSGVESSNPYPGSTSPDQGYAFWTARGEGSAVIGSLAARYVRYPDGRSELVGRGTLGTDPVAAGKLITENSTHIIFQTDNTSPNVAQQLEPNAPPTGTRTVYDRTSDEVTHVVSLLPGNITPAAGQHATYVGASADGNGIAFSIGSTLYLRVGNATTYEIGDGLAYAGVSDGGERIFYVKAGNLYAFDVASKEEIAFTTVGNAKVVNVAPGGTRAYFVTTTIIPGGGQNPNGAFAKAGQQNLYLSDEGDATFVASVTVRDVQGEAVGSTPAVDGLGLWTAALVSQQPAQDPSRVTPEGLTLLFQSRANLDGYDPGGFPQVYRYDHGADRLHCLSCLPTKVPASGGASLQSSTFGWVSNRPFSYFGFVPNLRADGRRAFFESKEPLVSSDTNGAQDIYEWEEQGVGSCDRAGGCIYLISSGDSARDNYLYGISSTGDDVFFTTEDILNGFDASDTVSIYDAKVGGGFPPPLSPSCQGEACRPLLTTPPPLPAPQTKVGPRNGNARQGKPCPKGKRKVQRGGKFRCVKKKHRKRRRGDARQTAGVAK